MTKQYIELHIVESDFAQAVMDFIEHKLPLAKAIREAKDLNSMVDISDIEGVENPIELIIFKVQYEKLKAHLMHAWEHENCEQELREEMREFGIDTLEPEIMLKEILYREDDIPVIQWEGEAMRVVDIENVITATEKSNITPSN